MAQPESLVRPTIALADEAAIVGATPKAPTPRSRSYSEAEQEELMDDALDAGRAASEDDLKRSGGF